MPGGRAACQTLFDEVIAKEFSDFQYGQIHRLTVDAYALQHPKEYMRSAKSYAAHLTGMCIALESHSDSNANQAIQRWLNGQKTLDRPSEPPQRERGLLSIVHVHAVTTPEDHVLRVRQWAQSVWEAWRAYHDVARRWVEEATHGAREGGAH